MNLVANSLCESESSQRIPLGRQAAEALLVSSRSRPIARAISSIDGFSIGIALVQHAIQTVFQALSTASRNAEPRIDFGVNGFDFLHRADVQVVHQELNIIQMHFPTGMHLHAESMLERSAGYHERR